MNQKKLQIFAAIIGIPLLISSCGSDNSNSDPFRVIIIADSHVIGPQYPVDNPTESDGIDNASIVRTEERFRAVRDQINALDPQPDMVFLLGDVVHDSFHFDELSGYQDERTAFEISSEILQTFDMPVHLIFGNHDYHVKCDGNGSYSRDLAHVLFNFYYDHEPYHSVDQNGFRFISLNGQLGHTWDETDSECNTSQASYGREQLEWLDAQLQEGLPTIIFTHYMNVLWSRNESDDSQWSGLEAVLNRHNNVQAVFAGHTHRWLDFSSMHTYDHYVIGATRYDTDNFWLLEFNPPTNSFSILDFDKARWSSTCGETFSYDGDVPTLVSGATETGDCNN